MPNNSRTHKDFSKIPKKEAVKEFFLKKIGPEDVKFNEKKSKIISENCNSCLFSIT
jgi:hypothetical protein